MTRRAEEERLGQDSAPSKRKAPPDMSFEVAEWLEAEILEHEQRTQHMGYDTLFDRTENRVRSEDSGKRQKT